jgi:4-hydroxy-2-oxoheptanedioate aldolase
MKTLKDRIYMGETVHGCWINLGSCVSAEIIGRAGFDWVLIDLEHGAGDIGVMYQQLQVLQATEAAPIVRIDELSRSKVQRILDAGATGIMFPQLTEKEEAGLAAQSMYYPPKGIRGMAKMVRATGFGTYPDDYIANLDRTLINIIQIETIEALQNIDSIASTEGVDVLFVGPNDLSLALGVFGQLQHPSYQQAIRSVAEAAKRVNKTAGVLLQDMREYEMYSTLGYRFLACGADGTFVTRGARDLVKELNLKRGT